MGYSKSPSTVNKIRDQLGSLETGRDQFWIAPFWVNGEKLSAFQWAYKLREALHIIRKHPGKFPELSRFAGRYTIEQPSENQVQAIIKSTGSQVTEQAVQAGETPIHMETASTLPLSIVGVKSVMEIINHFLKIQPNSEPLHYPDASLPEEDLRRLVKFAKAQTPPWMVIQAKGTNSITLMKEDPTVPPEARVSFDV